MPESGERKRLHLVVVDVNYLFFLLYAAWVRSRAERPSVSYTIFVDVNYHWATRNHGVRYIWPFLKAASTVLHTNGL